MQENPGVQGLKPDLNPPDPFEKDEYRLGHTMERVNQRGYPMDYPYDSEPAWRPEAAFDTGESYFGMDRSIEMEAIKRSSPSA